jgi:hypothetical protein
MADTATERLGIIRYGSGLQRHTRKDTARAARPVK